MPGGDGRGVTVVDFEYAFNYGHEDLRMSAAQHLAGEPFLGFGDDHGTAVLGILAARDNGFGVTGGVPAATIRTASPHLAGFYRPAPVITQAAAQMAVGDVLLLEQQAFGPTGAFVPLEWIPSVYDAVRAATAAGVVVVAAAGNGSVDLDGPALLGRFDRTRYNSGAIIVGAGDASGAPQGFSSFGSRLDVQAWGRNVVTTGYGDLFGGDHNVWYTNTFAGTSSASAITAATVASLQGYVKAASGTPLDAWAMAAVLRETGRPQTLGLARQIGASPDLLAAIGRVGPMNVAVDILPGTTRNPVALRPGSALIPVAVLTTSEFDAATLDRASLTLGDGAASETGVARRPNGSLAATLEDVDGDGDRDLILFFAAQALVENGDLTAATTHLVLQGRRADGRRVRGTDVVTVVPRT
jgi:hypothetical protein